MSFDGKILNERLVNAGITADQVTLDVILPLHVDQHENELVVNRSITEVLENGDLRIYPLTIRGEMVQRLKNTKQRIVENYFITRLAEPLPDGTRYKFRTGGDWGTHPFFCKSTIEAYNNKTEIKTLWITEGYIKALVCETVGVHCVGLSSITHNGTKTASGEKYLYNDVIDLIETCRIKNIVIMYDSDCTSLSQSDLYSKIDLANRPRRFYNSIEFIYNQLIQRISDTRGLDISFAFPTVKDGESKPCKGIDDAILYMRGQGREFKIDYNCKIVSLNQGVSQLKDFLLPEVKTFYEKNRNDIESRQFIYKNTAYEWDFKSEQPVQIIFHNIPPQVSLEQILRFNLYEYNGAYWYINSKKEAHNVSTFVMRTKYVIEDIEHGYRITELINQKGQRLTIEFKTEDFQKVESFRKKVESFSGFMFENNKAALEAIRKVQFENEKIAISLKSPGMNYETGVFFYENAAYKDGKVYEQNKNGIFEIEGQYYHVQKKPYAPTYRATHADISIQDYVKKLDLSSQKNGRFLFVYLLTQIFRPYCFDQEGELAFPFLVGIKGSGKTSNATRLYEIFNLKEKEINIVGSTLAAITDALVPFAGTLSVFDDFNFNGAGEKKCEILKGLFNGHGKARSSTKFETTVSEVNRGIILTGQELPIQVDALMSRCLFLYFNRIDPNNQEAKKAHQDLLSAENIGLNHILHQILDCHDFVRDNISRYYLDAKKQLDNLPHARWDKLTNSSQRSFNFAAMLLTMNNLITDAGVDIDSCFRAPGATPTDGGRGELFAGKLYDQIVKQNETMNTSNETKQYLQAVVSLINSHELRQSQYNLVTDRTTKKQKLYLRFSDIQHLVIKRYFELFNKRLLEDSSLKKYFESEPVCLGYKGQLKYKDGKTNTGYVFDYDLMVKEFDLSIDTDTQEEAEDTAPMATTANGF